MDNRVGEPWISRSCPAWIPRSGSVVVINNTQILLPVDKLWTMWIVIVDNFYDPALDVSSVRVTS